MPKNLENLTILFGFVTKNAEIMFLYLYLFMKCIPLFDNSNKQRTQKTIYSS